VAVSAEDVEFVTELFAGVGHITSRKMMGGLSIYADSQIFAILAADGQIYLKAKYEFAKRLEAAGAQPFTFTSKDGKQSRMNYWTLPGPALDDPELAAEWGKAALMAAYGQGK